VLSYNNSNGQSQLSYSKGVLQGAGSISTGSSRLKGSDIGTEVLVYCKSVALLQAEIENVKVNGVDGAIKVNVPFNAPLIASIASGMWSGDLLDNGVVTVEMDLTFSWAGALGIPLGLAQCGIQIELL